MENALTETERRILLNQYKILSVLDPNGKDDYQESISILENGFENEYENLAPDLHPEVSLEISEFVRHVLDVYDRIGRAIEKNNMELSESQRIHSLFHGFNSSSEDECLRYAEFLVKERGLFLRFQRADFSAPGEHVGNYRKVLSCWEGLTEAQRENLSFKELQILWES